MNRNKQDQRSPVLDARGKSEYLEENLQKQVWTGNQNGQLDTQRQDLELNPSLVLVVHSAKELQYLLPKHSYQVKLHKHKFFHHLHTNCPIQFGSSRYRVLDNITAEADLTL